VRTSPKICLAVIVAFAGATAHGQQANDNDIAPIIDSSILENTIEQDDSQANVVDENAPVEVVEERYKDGRVKVRREVTLDLAGNYIKHGSWQWFDISGGEAASGDFKNNKRHGTWKKSVNWGDTSLLNELPYTEFEAPFVSQAEFNEGLLHGKWVITDKDGRTASEWIYKDGELSGTAKWFFPDGSPREEIDYVEGKLDGNYRMWDQDGTEIINDTYQEGRKLASKQELHPSGALKWEGMFLHETYVIKKADDWWNTTPVVYEKTGKPERHGRFTSWYENGQKKFEGLFQHEVRAGDFTWWHENTQRAVQGAFKDNERHGLWSWWHENGQKAIQGQYDNGKLIGKWSYWTAGGKLERKVDYNGDPEPIAIHATPSTEIPVIADKRAEAAGTSAPVQK